MRALLLILALFSAPQAVAGPDRVSILLGSHHANATERFEGFNPGLFLEWSRSERQSYSLGIYRNSYGDVTLAGGVNLGVFNRRDFQADLFAGIAHYPDHGRRLAVSIGDVVPLLGVRLRYRSLYALILPGDGKATDFIVGAGVTFPLN